MPLSFLYDYAPLALPLAIAVFVYMSADFVDKHASKDALADFSKFLKNYKYELYIGSFPSIIIYIFNFLFGVRHFSIKCFFRSAIFSFCSIFSLFFISFLWQPSTIISLIKSVHAFKVPSTHHHIGIQACLVLLAWIIVVDYVNLFKSRIVLEILELKALSQRAFFALFFADLIFSVLLFFHSILIVITLITSIKILQINNQTLTPVAMIISWFSSWVVIQPFAAMFIFGSHLFNFIYLIPIADFYWASTVPSVWIWTYIFSSLFVRFLIRIFPRIRVLTGYFLDVTEHPIRSVGFLAASFTFVVTFIGSAIWVYFVKPVSLG